MTDVSTPPSENPFDQMDPKGLALGIPDMAAPQASANPFDNVDIGQNGGSSGFGSFVRGAVGGAAPAAGSLAGAGFGAARGAAIGAMIPGLGETGIGEAGGAIVGGLLGGFGGSFAAAKAQSYGLSKLPDSWTEALGQDDRQQRLDQEQHPYASFLGGLAPFALTMHPGIGGASAAAKALPDNSTALQRLMVNPVTARLFSGALMGGMELGQEAAEGNVDWNKVAISTGFGLVFNRPNRFGEAIEGSIPRLLGQNAARAGAEAGAEAAHPAEPPAPETPEEGLASYEHPPTLNEASAFGVGGPGASEETFFGSLQRDATAQETANAALREENATVGPMDEVDVDALARSSARNLFIRYDQLKATRDALADRMRELRAPDDEEIQEAKSQIDDLQSRYEDVLAANKGHTGGVEQRRLRAQIRDAQRAHDDLMARKTADNEEPLRVATEQYQAADYAMRDIGPAAGAARRRAAERAGAEMVAPAAVETESEDVVAKPPTAEVTAQTPTLAETAKPVKPLPEQKAAIAADVKRQLVAAGRPEDQAEDVGTLTANHFAVLASQFKGALGTAEDIYRREGPEWRGVAPEPAAARAPFPSIEERIAELEAQPKAEPIPPIAQPRRAAKKAKAGETKTEPASKISAEDVRAKAKSLEVENLIDALQGAGASGKEIEAVIGKKLTADEIEAMKGEVRGPAPRANAGNRAEVKRNEETPSAETSESQKPVVKITFQGKTYTGTTELDAVTAAHEATNTSIDRIWSDIHPDTLNQGKREKFGSYARGEPRGVIKLFSTANASTAIHELGHDFLERMKRYGNHDLAPLQLRADWVTLKRALHIEDGATRIKTPAHEQFARWFEQYLHEGVAPSKELAGVFSRFKNWMANVYKNVRDIFDKRQTPMNADVRAVFDRMLAEEPHATVIAPEPARVPTLPDIHAIEAEKLSPAQALPAAERVAAERAEATPSPEAEHEIAPTLAEIKAERTGPGADAAGEAGLGDAGLRKVESGGGEAGHEPGGGGVGGAAGEKREGGDAAAAESVGAATGGSASTGRPQSGDPLRNVPLAPRPADILTAPSRFVDDKADNIRLDNVNGAEDLKAAARELAEILKKTHLVDDRPQSDAELMQLQAAIGLDDLTRKKLGEGFSSAENMAAQRIAGQMWRAKLDASKRYTQTRSDDDLAAFELAHQKALLAQAVFSRSLTESGRAERATRKIQEFWTPGAEAARAATLKGGAVTIKEAIEKSSGRPLWQVKQEAVLCSAYEDAQSVARFTTWSKNHSFGRMLLEYWINGLISGTATHTTYLVGNVLLSMEKGLLETPVAAAIGALRPVMGREGGNVVRLGEAAARLRGGVSGYAPAASAALETFRTGLTGTLPGHGEAFRLPFQPESAPQTGGVRLNEQATMRDVKAALYGAWRGILDGTLSIGKILQAAPEGSPTFSTEYSHLGAIPNWRVGGGVIPVGTLARLPSRGIATIHTFMRALNYSMEKNAAIYRQALAEGEKAGWSEAQTHARMADLTNNTPEDIATNSSTAATELTLMGPAGEFTRKLSALTNWAPNIPGLGETPILKFIDPFVHIASNIIDQSIVQRTPAGLLSSEIRADLTGRNGVAAQDMAQARMIVGTALSLGFGALAASGYVSGSGPMDRDKAAMWRLAGNQPHSVRIGDTWYAMNRLGPLGMLLGMSADMYDVAHSASQGDMLQAGALLQHAITQNVLDESFMRGPADLIQAVEDPGRYGERYIQNFASSFVPMSVALAQMDRASDPFTRQARTVMDSIRAKVPGLSEQLFPKRDIWGQAIPNHDALVAAGFTAIYEQSMSRDPVNLALAAMGIGFAAVGRTIRNVRLSDEQYDDYARIAGRMAKQRLDVFVRSPDWQQWPVGVRADAAKAIIEQCREAARGMMFMKYPAILAQATRQKMQKLGVAQ